MLINKDIRSKFQVDEGFYIHLLLWTRVRDLKTLLDAGHLVGVCILERVIISRECRYNMSLSIVVDPGESVAYKFAVLGRVGCLY